MKHMVTVAKNQIVDINEVISRSPVAALLGAASVLRECVFRSIEVRYGIVDGKVACIWGLIPPTLLSDTAYLWLLTTEIVAEHKFLFIRHSQRYIEEALKVYPSITGDVVLPNPQAVRWLAWLGARFGELDGRRLPFVIQAKHG